MFIRNRHKPRTLQKIDALIPRLPIGHAQLPKLRRNAAKLQKGYNGERRLDYHLRSLSEDFHVLSDVCLRIHNKDYQMDSLVISPHSIYIFEEKTFDGILTFDTTHRQLIQTNNNQEKSYTYPLTQADNASYLLMQWLQSNGHYGVPIHSLISLAQPSTIIRVEGDKEHIAKFVIQV